MNPSVDFQVTVNTRSLQCSSEQKQCGSVNSTCIETSSQCCNSSYNDGFSCSTGNHCEHTLNGPRCCQDGDFLCNGIEIGYPGGTGSWVCCPEGQVCDPYTNRSQVQCLEKNTFDKVLSDYHEGVPISNSPSETNIMILVLCVFFGIYPTYLTFAEGSQFSVLLVLSGSGSGNAITPVSAVDRRSPPIIQSLDLMMRENALSSGIGRYIS
jgi:hypothetical protein